MENLFDLVINNYETFLVIVASLITVLTVIVRLTPTKEDDKYLEIFVRAFNLIKSNVKVEDLKSIEEKVNSIKKEFTKK